jgi:hypothetical protein
MQRMNLAAKAICMRPSYWHLCTSKCTFKYIILYKYIGRIVEKKLGIRFRYCFETCKGIEAGMWAGATVTIPKQFVQVLYPSQFNIKSLHKIRKCDLGRAFVSFTNQIVLSLYIMLFAVEYPSKQLLYVSMLHDCEPLSYSLLTNALCVQVSATTGLQREGHHHSGHVQRPSFAAQTPH